MIAQSPHPSRRNAEGRVLQASAKAKSFGRCIVEGKESVISRAVWNERTRRNMLRPKGWGYLRMLKKETVANVWAQ
jgi:hypothetical protein